jgi:hypothetical protein
MHPILTTIMIDHRVLVSPRYARVLVADIVESRFACIRVFLTFFQGL